MVDPILIGIDVGGTFTDFVVWHAGHMELFKVPTTPEDQSRAIVEGLGKLGLLQDKADSSPSPSLIIVHGMTVATNALLERRGAATALLTTEGFADVLTIGRQNRPFLYRLSQARPPALAPDQRRFEVFERVGAEGEVIHALDPAAFPALITALKSTQTESLAIVFLFSFRNPTHEQQAAALIQEHLPDLPISLSSEILPEYREYERTATTVINAYVQPLVSRYLARLAQALNDELRLKPDDNSEFRAADSRPAPPTQIRIMQSNGGVIGLGHAAEQAARVVLSGPAGGVVGAFSVAKQAQAYQPAQGAAVNILTFDMGGTSTDVCLCPDRVPTTAESTITDLPLRLPVIDIHTVGAGGGSIAYVDAGGALQVGPRSAGAVPGPVCYGRGGVEPTVTDANAVLGRLDPGGFLGGSGQLRLDVDGARRALTALGRKLNMPAEAAALGVVRVANATMERALRRVSIEQGHDPRMFVLLPFGGAGPLHACDLAEALNIRRILCPPFPGVLSAYGMLVADVTSDAAQSVLDTVENLTAHTAPLLTAYKDLEARVRDVMDQERVQRVTMNTALDMRYRGQSYELTVPLEMPIDEYTLGQATGAFHAAHEQRYGYAMEEETVEIVTLRVRATCPGARLQLPRLPESTADATGAQVAEHPVWFHASGPVPTAVYRRDNLLPGNRFLGPAVVLQYDSTVIVAPGWNSDMDVFGNLWLNQVET